MDKIITESGTALYIGTKADCIYLVQGISTMLYDIEPVKKGVNNDVEPQGLDPVCRVMLERKLR